MDLALNNLQRLICHKTHQTETFGVVVIVVENGQDDRWLELLNILTASLQIDQNDTKPSEYHFIVIAPRSTTVQSAGAEHTDCRRVRPHPISVLDMTLNSQMVRS